MMTLRYEVNPPKVIQSNVSHDELQRSLDNIKQRIVNISKNCNGIHITDSVLGIPRVSPLTLAALIRDFSKKIEITISLRVIDKTLDVLTQSVSDAISLGLNGVLILKGDMSADNPKDSGLIPSQVVKHLNESGFNKKIDLFLSLPSNPDFKKIGKKLDAEPAGFITQVIHSEKQVTRIVDELNPQGFKVIPCVLLPSEKNANSAKFLKLDWSGYQNNVVDFIKNIHSVAGDVLVSSPNDYAKAQKLFESL